MVSSAAQSIKLPIIDFTIENLKPGTNSWAKTSKEIREALEKYGCFILESKIVSPQLHSEVLIALKELFDLPTETKMKNRYQMPLNGYVGQIDKIPLHESMGIQNLISLEEIQKFSSLMWPHHGNHHFCENIYEYSKLVAEIDQMVTRMIFESYGVEIKHYDSYVESTTYLLRLLKNRIPKADESNLGFLSHTDKSFTTILHQNHINALQVETDDGQFITVDFSSPSFFVVVAGDALTGWSNDRIVAPRHRVIMNGKEDRYSMALFAFNKGIIEVPKELVDEDHPLMYKPFDHLGLLNFYLKQSDRGKSSIKEYCGM